MTAPPPDQPSFGGWFGSMWLYSILRFGLFFALWGILVLVGLHGFLAPIVALLLSIPLSFVLLAKPRAAFSRQIAMRVDQHRASRADLDAQLDPDSNRDL